MTWIVFLQAMRKGLVNRASIRKANTTMTSGTMRPVSTQAKLATPKNAEISNQDAWDYILMSSVFAT